MKWMLQKKWRTKKMRELDEVIEICCANKESAWDRLQCIITIYTAIAVGLAIWKMICEENRTVE